MAFSGAPAPLGKRPLSKVAILENYFYSNLMAAFWSTFLLLGGGVFIAYFLHISYMPEFDLKSSVTITAAAAFTSILVTGAVLVMTILPALGWSFIVGNSDQFKSWWTTETGSRIPVKVARWFVLPAIVAFVITVAWPYYFGWYSFLLIVPPAALILCCLSVRAKKADMFAARPYCLGWCSFLLAVPLAVLTLRGSLVGARRADEFREYLKEGWLLLQEGLLLWAGIVVPTLAAWRRS